MSKGSSPRPYSVSQDQFASNWDAIFSKAPPKDEIGKCGCGRSPTGKCIGWHGFSESEYQDALAQYNQTHNNQ